jgi:hypothetical protein
LNGEGELNESILAMASKLTSVGIAPQGLPTCTDRMNTTLHTMMFQKVNSPRVIWYTETENNSHRVFATSCASSTPLLTAHSYSQSMAIT